MLKTCYSPVKYYNTESRTCGEIVYKSFDDLSIHCTLCEIRIVEFEEFIEHLKNIHWEDLQLPSEDSQRVTRSSAAAKKVKDIETNSTDTEEGSIGAEQYETKSEELYDISEITIEKAFVENEFSAEEEHKLDISEREQVEYDYFFIENLKEEVLEEDEEENKEEKHEEQAQSTNIKTRKSKDFVCQICNKKYADDRRLQMHAKIMHSRETPHKCSHCDQAYAEERHLQMHINSKHSGFECPQCHKSFSSKRNLKRHMPIHAQIKDFVCDFKDCGKAFASKTLLKFHQRCHSQDVFICEECGYKCRQRESLIVHKRHHTGEKPFTCNQCESSFASKPLLKEHMARHETERKHVCEVCGKSFNRPKALYHHKHLHLGIKKFVCKICGAAYAQAAGLSAHARKHRPDTSAFLNEHSSSSRPTNVVNSFLIKIQK